MTDSPVTLVADDIYQVKIPLPFALNSVNVYLLRGDVGWTIVDTGINTQIARDTWQIAFDELKITPHDIEQIVLTHVHPDHFGLAGWLQSLAKEAGRDVPIVLSPREEQAVQEIWLEKLVVDFVGWLTASGMTVAMAEEVSDSMTHTRAMTRPHPTALTQHKAGQPIRMGNRTFQTIHAPGHSDGQLIFYDEADKLLLSGDHVLMKITPNIGLWVMSDPNPLGLFLDSLKTVRDLDVRLALPGHKWLIEDWQGRIDEIIHHHDLRLNHTLEAIEAGNHIPYDIAEHIFPTERFTVHEWRFAVAETFAHLDYLRRRGKITQADGKRHFSLA
ncbi:MAG: MBL fold metallo-hydrolase [Anaerolineae bacterium]|nr:MBL fold metallo-hydrolase [Anaerolineae bacterium]